VLGGPGSSVIANRINNGPIAIAYAEDPGATSGATTTIAYNKIWSVFSGGIAIGPSTREIFVVVNNSIRILGGSAISAARVPTLTLANNIVRGLHVFALELIRPGTLSEHHNLWWRDAGAPLFAYGIAAPTTYSTLAAYRLASGAGAGDLVANPLTADPAFIPAAGSPVLNAGSAVVAGAVYVPACDALPFSYCGAAPEIGATEVP
jgi:hypothetical protein